MGEFIIYPAIDLRGGKVVRLKQGDPARQKTYDDDPLHVAQRWLSAGASWLHVVNLDGAFGELHSEDNLDALKVIIQTGSQIQFGGGLRTWDDIRNVLELGVSRIVLGTVAIEDLELVKRTIATFGAHRVAVSIDVQSGEIRVRGWKKGYPLDPINLAMDLKELGIQRLIVTDITKDGMDEGVSLDLACRMAEELRLSVIVAGGVNSLDDVRKAHQAGLEGIIIGRALYEGQVSLEEALQC
jgi:phosphoribosylformimino-5-aminoimidazole carboxamide ribotide isomerase